MSIESHAHIKDVAGSSRGDHDFYGQPQRCPLRARGCPRPSGATSRSRFPSWLSQAGGSIVLTTYQAGKVGMIGWDGRQVTLLFRDFPKPMGLDVEGPRLLLATHHQVIELVNAPLLAYEFLEGQPGRYDALYLPRVAYDTGDLNVHDVAFGAEGLWMVNTRFSCLCNPSRDYSFIPRWRPPFISEVVPEDRCHLNGLAMEERTAAVRHRPGRDGSCRRLAGEEGRWRRWSSTCRRARSSCAG